MTLENYNYRTDSLFLRNQFFTDNVYGIPLLPKVNLENGELEDLRLIAFNQLKNDNGKHKDRFAHFFLYDYNFEKVWSNPNKYIELLSKYKAILTPDFSMYLEMPYALKLYNIFRNRWCGAFYASKGLKVIPTVNWGDEDTFDFCFKGIEKGSIVAVSTYMFHEHGNHSNQKDIFMRGYNKMLEEIEPSKIICYSEPFEEMKGDIIYVDYDLNSWQHLSYEKSFSCLHDTKKSDIIIKYGYVCKGGGSANGGEWQPKNKNDERFLGKPNTISHSHHDTKKGGYDVDTKYGSDGKAVGERHYTDHSYPNYHTNPHDHKITWEGNHPNWHGQENYPDGIIPEFKNYHIGDYIMNENNTYNPDDYKFETLGEFKIYLTSGANVGFEHNSVEYGIEGHNNRFDIWIYDKGGIASELTLEQVLDYELEGEKIRNLILDAIIIERI